MILTFVRKEAYAIWYALLFFGNRMVILYPQSFIAKVFVWISKQSFFQSKCNDMNFSR